MEGLNRSQICLNCNSRVSLEGLEVVQGQRLLAELFQGRKHHLKRQQKLQEGHPADLDLRLHVDFLQRLFKLREYDLKLPAELKNQKK